ncbi:MAG: M15 family metallopeptidase, partial [Elusimicrobiota bacterium]
MLAVIFALTAPALAVDPLVDVRTAAPDVVLDMRYATARNILGKAVYPSPAAFLRRSTAAKLARATRALAARGRRLVIYDAYRPLSVQRLLWAAKPDRRFVADPARGSVHNRGGAVDGGVGAARRAPGAMPPPLEQLGTRGPRRAARGAT